MGPCLASRCLPGGEMGGWDLVGPWARALLVGACPAAKLVAGISWAGGRDLVGPWARGPKLVEPLLVLQTTLSFLILKAVKSPFATVSFSTCVCLTFAALGVFEISENQCSV